MGMYRDWARHADAIFYEYEENRKKLEQMTEDAIYGSKTYGNTPVSGGYRGDPVLRSVEALSAERIEMLRKEVSAVDRVCSRMCRGKEFSRGMLVLNFFEGMCIERLDAPAMAEKLGVSVKTVKRLKKTARMLLAAELGWE